MKESSIERSWPADPEGAVRWLISAGYRESEGALVLENFAPVGAEGGSLTPERWRELVECAAAYIRWSGAGSFRDAPIDLTLVLPPFADPVWQPSSSAGLRRW